MLTGSNSETIIVKISALLSQHGVIFALLAGVILAGILASTMSTSDSQLLAASSAVSSDILGAFRKDSSNKNGSMAAARITLLVISVVAAFIARNPDSSVFAIVSFAWAGFGAAFGPVVLFSLFWKRTNKWGALAGMVCGGSMVFIWKYLIRPLGGIWNIYELLPAFLIACAAIVSVNPDAKVYVRVTNSWYDPEGEKAAAQTLLNLGCDVIAQHCDTVYPQTLAQEKGVYSIGYNSDMSKDAPQSCLCSVVWNWSAYYTAAVQSVIDGSWDGSNYYGGMNENLVSITDLADFCAEGTKEKVEEAKKQILSGENGVFDGVIETNTGETVGKEGTTLDDATITGGINWYFKTVSVVE